MKLFDLIMCKVFELISSKYLIEFVQKLCRRNCIRYNYGKKEILYLNTVIFTIILAVYCFLINTNYAY